MSEGLLVAPCEWVLGEPVPTSGIGREVIRGTPELLTRYLLEGRPGMSGGPVIAGDRLVGVTVLAGPTIATISTGLTFAVPVDYVHAWYLRARGITDAKPLKVCEPPEFSDPSRP